MDRLEFSISFDTYFNNITSNQAPGLNEHEKSLFLTKAQDEVLKNYFNPKSNKLQEGFDDNQKRQIDFSSITKVVTENKIVEVMDCYKATTDFDEGGTLVFYLNQDFDALDIKAVIGETESVSIESDDIVIHYLSNVTYTASKLNQMINNSDVLRGNLWVKGNGHFDSNLIESPETLVNDWSETAEERVVDIAKIDPRSTLFEFPKDVLFVVNERVYSDINRLLRVIPINFEEYDRLMSKPYKYPTKYCAWRLLSTDATKYVELIAPGELSDYRIRYVRKPKPIILADLGLSINGYYFEGGTVPEGGNYLPTDGECELDPILHEEILQRAVELAKIAWTQTGQDNTQAVLQAGQRSE